MNLIINTVGGQLLTLTPEMLQEGKARSQIRHSFTRY